MYYIIVNPASRSGRSVEIWNQIEPILKEREVAYRVFFSKEAGHVIRLVRELSQSVLTQRPLEPFKLIVLGGDGTMNEALQGITDFERTQLGYIPSGSSNDLARDLHPSKKPSEILESILSCKTPFLMDLGLLTFETVKESISFPDMPKLTKRYFAVSSGIGFDAAVCEEALTSKIKNAFNKIGLGKLTYLAIALKQLLMSKKISCTITLADGTAIHLPKFFFIASMQHQYEGGGFMFCPKADYQDGLLDICVVGDIPKWLALFALPTAFKGQHYRFKGVDRYQAKELQIETSAPLWVHTDGEVIVKSDRITIACEKQKLQFMI